MDASRKSPDGVLLALPSPLDAYREDVARQPNMPDFGPFEAIWLIVACGLHRLAQLPIADRASSSGALSQSLEAIRHDESTRDDPAPANAVPITDRLQSLQTSLQGFSEGASSSPLLESTRQFASDVEEAGALLLARSLLAGALRLAADAGPREQGSALAQLGRIARTLGDFETAESHYVSAGVIGKQFDIPDLVVWEAMGRAVIALRRGNYPRARELFRKGVSIAEANGLAELAQQGHNGLLIAAAEAGDFELALEHGWRAFMGERGRPARQADLLGNLSQVCLRIGYPSAALNGYLAALSLSNSPRIRLPALGNAAHAAARSGNLEVLRSTARAIERESSMNLPYETGQAWAGLAKAYAAIGADPELSDAIARTRRLAREGGFFELMYAMEQIETVRAAKPRQKKLSDDSARVVESIERLPSQDALLELAGQHNHG